MDFVVSGYTDIGNKRQANQDGYGIQVAQTRYGKAFFSVLCDGVGGLKCGELASATAVKAFFDWFEQYFSNAANPELDLEGIVSDWVTLADEVDRAIKTYSEYSNIQTGTTIALLLLVGDVALAANVGDSRIYYVQQGRLLQQITEDHTLAQREYDCGRISAEQLRTDKRRNILLQCIGTGRKLSLSAASLSYAAGDAFFLCSDGFYQELDESDFLRIFEKREHSTLSLEQSLRDATETVKSRGETDNISAVAVLAK